MDILEYKHHLWGPGSSRPRSQRILNQGNDMHYDIIVVGAGQAGVPLAARLAESGRRVLLAERGHLGGTCVNTGCTPTKTMVASARAAHVARTAGPLGVRTGRVKVDLAAVVDRKDTIVQQWRSGVRKRLEKAGDDLTLVREAARFTGPRTLSTGGDTHSADHVIINAGCRPVVPTIDGLDTVPWYDNDRIMDLRELPRHLVVIGSGYIGCEFGQMFRRFGARVTMIDHNDHLLSREDHDVSEALEGVFADEGITLRLGSPVRTVGQDEKGLVVTLASRRKVRGSHLLVATGRRPNTDDLGCDAAGVTLDERGFIQVDDHYCTSAEGVYAVGDVTGGPQFTHSSWDDHRILFDLLTGMGLRTRADRIVPTTVFTDPQVATVGLTERQARQQGIPFDLAALPWKSIARAQETDQTAGVVKVLVHPEDERFLGASIVGAEAGELIHVFVALMKAGATARAVVDSEMVHPTFAEGLQTALMKLDRYALKP